MMNGLYGRAGEPRSSVKGMSTSGVRQKNPSIAYLSGCGHPQYTTTTQSEICLLRENEITAILLGSNSVPQYRGQVLSASKEPCSKTHRFS